MQLTMSMQTPVEITFRSFPPSAAVERAIHRWVDRLEQVFGRITSCRVVIEVPHRHVGQGRTFHVRVDLAVPDHTISVGRDPGRDHAHEDVYVAVADAFRAARRQLQDRVHIQRGDVKLHA